MNYQDKPSRLVFTIPELQQAIFRDSGLSSKDLLHSTLVCRAWFAIVTPFFWENVKISMNCYDHVVQENGGKNFVFKDGIRLGIIKYGNRIRRLQTVDADVLKWLVESDHGGSELLELDFKLFGLYLHQTKTPPHLRLMTAKTLTTNAAKLEQWKCFAEGYHAGHHDRVNFSDLAPGLMALKPGYLKVLLIQESKVGNELTLVLHQHWEQIQSLQLICCQFLDDIFTEFLTPLIHLKTLTFTIYKGDNLSKEFRDGLQKLLQGIPYLVELKLARCNLFWIETLRTALDRGCLGVLKDLSLDIYTWSDAANAHALMRVLKAVPHSVTRLTLGSFYPLDSQGNNVLLNLAVGNRLTYLKVHRHCGIKSKTWQKILTTCRFLVEIGTEGLHTEPWLNVEDMTEPWICLDLELFALNIKLKSGKIGILAEEKVLNQCERLFLQLASLPKLKHLQMRLETPEPKDWDRKNHGEGAEMKRRFLEKWSILEACTRMRFVLIDIFLWMTKMDTMTLQQACVDMWGSHVEAKVFSSERA